MVFDRDELHVEVAVGLDRRQSDVVNHDFVYQLIVVSLIIWLKNEGLGAFSGEGFETTVRILFVDFNSFELKLAFLLAVRENISGWLLGTDFVHLSDV